MLGHLLLLAALLPTVTGVPDAGEWRKMTCQAGLGLSQQDTVTAEVVLTATYELPRRSNVVCGRLKLPAHEPCLELVASAEVLACRVAGPAVAGQKKPPERLVYTEIADIVHGTARHHMEARNPYFGQLLGELRDKAGKKPLTRQALFAGGMATVVMRLEGRTTRYPLELTRAKPGASGCAIVGGALHPPKKKGASAPSAAQPAVAPLKLARVFCR